ncbi:MAG: hypothetical protein RLZZ350_293, partial [Verrucomicrobiota bacterium]
MSGRIHWLTPAVLAASAAVGHATVYLNVEQAQAAI